jgi:hypothetical protein
LARLGLCTLPEELAEPQELRDIRAATAVEAGAAT